MESYKCGLLWLTSFTLPNVSQVSLCCSVYQYFLFIYFFLWPNNIPWYGETTFCWLIHQLMAIWAASALWLVQTMLPWTATCRCLCKCSSLVCVCVCVCASAELLCHVSTQRLTAHFVGKDSTCSQGLEGEEMRRKGTFLRSTLICSIKGDFV